MTEVPCEDKGSLGNNVIFAHLCSNTHTEYKKKIFRRLATKITKITKTNFRSNYMHKVEEQHAKKGIIICV